MKSLSKTPSPKKDRIHGSKVNPKGSASSEKSASSIKFNPKTTASLITKLKEFKETHDTKKVSLSDLKAVYRRGLGAYSTSHRPNIPRNAWAMARVNAFLRKAGGGEHKKAYVQDDDLLKYAEGGKVKFNDKELLEKYKSGESIGFTGIAHLKSEGLIKRVDGTKRKSMAEGGDVGQDIKCRRCGWEWNSKDSEEFDKYVCHNCGFDNRMYYDKNPIGFKDGGEVNNCKKFILQNKSVLTNGFYFDMHELSKLFDPYGQVPLNLDFTLVSYNSGGQSGLGVIDTINPTQLISELTRLTNITKNQAYVVAHYFMDNAKRLTDISQITTEKIVVVDRDRVVCENLNEYADGGEVDDKKKTYEKWKTLVNMSSGEIKKFYDSKDGKEAGLSKSEANKQGISNGRESARWVMRMKQTPKYEWTPTMWKWANKQISFISRMSGNEGGLYDEKGNKTRKHTSLLIWGHNPKKSSSMKYENGGEIGITYFIGRPEVDRTGRFGKKRATWKTCVVDENGNKRYGGYTINLSGSASNIKLDGIKITQRDFDKLIFENKMADGGQMDVRMEDIVQRMDNPEFADISLYRKGGKIDWTEFYMDGGMNKTCEKFDSNGERKIDMKSIDELTYCVNNLPQTKEFHFHDGQYDADRKKLHKEIIYKIKKDLVCVESDKPIAIMMGGSPASGKSTFLKKYRPYLLEHEILKVDADEIRSQLPEYKGFNATQTHLETKDIVNLLLSDRNIGIPCRFDLIYDGTMNNTKSYLPLIALLKSLGYRIYVVYIDNVPKDVIVNRALERYKRSGRFVPLEVIDDFFTRGKSALNEIKKEVDGYMIVDGSDSNYHVIEKGGMQLPKNRRYSKIGEPIKITTEDVVREYKRGGELNPDNPQLKNEVVHKSGKVGGMLVGQRHSEGGIKALNKSTGQPLEMEGGEVVITRNAVSDDKKRMFEGKMMTNKEILSKINESGGGVSFAKGGNVKAKDDCGCGGYEGGGNVKDMKQQYPKDFEKGVREETREHSDTFSDLKRNKISLKEAAEKVVAKHLSEKPNYYKNYKHGGFLTFADKQIPSLDAFIKGGHMVNSPFVGESIMYGVHEEAESNEHKFHRLDDKKAKPISNLLAYETYLYDNFGILFSQLPTQVQNALTLGKQALIENYINS